MNVPAKALDEVIAAMEPLTPRARARVLLFVALRYGIDLGDAEFLKLVRTGLEPSGGKP